MTWRHKKVPDKVQLVKYSKTGSTGDLQVHESATDNDAAVSLAMEEAGNWAILD